MVMLGHRRHILISAGRKEEVPVLEIQSPDTFAGRTLYLKCAYDEQQATASSWNLDSGGEYATLNQNGRLDVVEGTQNQTISVSCSYLQYTASKSIVVSYGNQLDIECADSIRGTSTTLIARYNS